MTATTLLHREDTPTVVRLAGLSPADAATTIARASTTRAQRRLVVDTGGSDVITLPLLAALVRLRRHSRQRGGDVVIVADADTATLLLHSGLFRSLPVFDSVQTALANLAP